MSKTVEAIIEQDGTVRLLETVRLDRSCRAIVTLLEEDLSAHECALLSERALAEDWNRKEEDIAWAHLQQDLSS